MTAPHDEPATPRRRVLWAAAVPLVAAVALALVLVVQALRPATGAAAQPTGPAGSSAPVPTTTPLAAGPTPAGPTAPTAAPPAGEGEPPPGWDSPGDGPVTPDDELTQADVDALLRAPATGPDGATACAADDVAYELTGFDAAAGHRYATLLVRNVSGRPCTVSGYLGVGGRGTWGNAFLLAVEQAPVGGEDPAAAVVALPAGAAAHAWLEWTGALAGADQERLSSFALQLAAGQPARLYAAVGADGAPLDVGMLTTVRIGPLRPAG